MKMCLLVLRRKQERMKFFERFYGCRIRIMVETFNQNFILKLEEGCFRLSNLNWVN